MAHDRGAAVLERSGNAAGRLHNLDHAHRPLLRALPHLHAESEFERLEPEIDGKVDRPTTLTMADLKKLPRVDLVGVLECAGKKVLRAARRRRTMGFRFGRQRTMDRASPARRPPESRHPECGNRSSVRRRRRAPGYHARFSTHHHRRQSPSSRHLAGLRNERPAAAREHGIPAASDRARLAGDSWVKWLQHIEVLDHEFEGFWMKSAYRHPANPVAPGTAVDPSRYGLPVTDLGVKSVIAVPSTWAKPGPVRAGHGLVQQFAGRQGRRLHRWRPDLERELGGPPTQYGWRLWQVDWKAAEGRYTLMSRATNAAGQAQPLMEQWNPNGYLWNVAQPVAVTISDQAPAAPAPAPSPEETQPPESYKTACFVCHDDYMMQQQRLDACPMGSRIE